MRRRENFFPVFFLFLFLSLIIWGLSPLGFWNGARSVAEKIFSPLEGVKYGIFQKIPAFFEDPRVRSLTAENIALRSQIVDQKKLTAENAALSDQFETTSPTSYHLLPAGIISAPGFIPGTSVPNTFILNRGSRDGIRVGEAVIVKDNLVGIVSQVSENLAKVNLINSSSASFTAKTEAGAVGIFKGGGSLLLSNVLLSDNLKTGELVLTKGDLDVNGIGLPADLIIGKITSVDKNPSDLFQKAELESLVNFITLSTVFVYISAK